MQQLPHVPSSAVCCVVFCTLPKFIWISAEKPSLSLSRLEQMHHYTVNRLKYTYLVLLKCSRDHRRVAILWARQPWRKKQQLRWITWEQHPADFVDLERGPSSTICGIQGIQGIVNSRPAKTVLKSPNTPPKIARQISLYFHYFAGRCLFCEADNENNTDNSKHRRDTFKKGFKPVKRSKSPQKSPVLRKLT